MENMNPYTKNPGCSCSRCRASRLFGPAMIITVGVLLLLQENGVIWFYRSWPVLLLVAGLFSFLSASASTEGHVQPYGPMNMPLAQPGFAQQGAAQTGVAQITPAPPQAPTTDAAAGNPTNNDTQVKS
jgi:hypothetical protein